MYKSLIDNMPYGLEKHILSVLSSRVGKDNAIKRYDLLAVIQRMPITGFETVDDRQIRKSIETLRRKGVRICNDLSGDGYFISDNDQEYQEFKLKYTAYARTIFKTAKAMDEGHEVEIRDDEVIELNPIEVQMNLLGSM